MDDILRVGLALGPVGLILIGSEVLWRTKTVRGERARKFIHILAGVWMAFWPLYLPFDGIVILGIAALTLLLYSRYTRLFSSIYDVKRITYGELLYALAIIVVALFAEADWIFTASILMLALADGGAAVIGRFYGITNSYLVFGSQQLKKSVAGSAAFILFAFVVMIIAGLVADGDVYEGHELLVFVVVPLFSLALENITPYGVDNIVTPIFVMAVLNSIA